MVIVSSEVTGVDHEQVDGRRYITEQHVDSVGGVHVVTYLAEVGADTAAILAKNAASLSLTLPQSEIIVNVAQIASVYPPVVTMNFATASELNSMLRSEYATALAVKAVLIGAYLSELTDADLAACFEVANPSSELTALRSALSSQLAMRNAGLTQRGQ